MARLCNHICFSTRLIKTANAICFVKARWLVRLDPTRLNLGVSFWPLFDISNRFCAPLSKIDFWDFRPSPWQPYPRCKRNWTSHVKASTCSWIMTGMVAKFSSVNTGKLRRMAILLTANSCTSQGFSFFRDESPFMLYCHSYILFMVKSYSLTQISPDLITDDQILSRLA